MISPEKKPRLVFWIGNCVTQYCTEGGDSLREKIPEKEGDKTDLWGREGTPAGQYSCRGEEWQYRAYPPAYTGMKEGRDRLRLVESMGKRKKEEKG